MHGIEARSRNRTVLLITWVVTAWLVVRPVCVFAAQDQAGSETLEDAEAWFEDDWEERVREVNEGELEFLETPPDRRVLNTRNTLTITPDSIATGWVELYQCQSNLDPLPSVEVVYRYTGIRNLRVVSSRGIGEVQITSHTVQLADVIDGGEVCICAEVRVLNKTPAGVYEITSGPFHRRFFDGYFPVHLQYSLNYPAEMLSIESVEPTAQKGFEHNRVDGRLNIDAWFEGKLLITVRFGLIQDKMAGGHAAHSFSFPLPWCCIPDG